MRSVLNISEAASLALHSMALLASRGSEPHPVRELAETIGASEHHLAKVLQRLARSGLVKARRGPGGGFELARPAGDITLLEVLETIDGPLRPSDCLMGTPGCMGDVCIMGDLVASINRMVGRHLAATKLAEFEGVY